jgi:hypothetical protein
LYLHFPPSPAGSTASPAGCTLGWLSRVAPGVLFPSPLILASLLSMRINLAALIAAEALPGSQALAPPFRVRHPEPACGRRAQRGLFLGFLRLRATRKNLLFTIQLVL